MVKHLPTMRETWVRSLGWEDLLEKEVATHSSILAWRIPQMEEPGRLQSMGSQTVGSMGSKLLSECTTTTTLGVLLEKRIRKDFWVGKNKNIIHILKYKEYSNKF